MNTELHSTAIDINIVGKNGFKNDKKPELILRDDAPQVPYVGKTDKSAMHMGQTKLALSEIETLTKFYIDDMKPNNITWDDVLFVYAGAASYRHGYLIHKKLFPGMRIVLVDPNPFDESIYNLKLSGIDIKIHTHEDGKEGSGFFTDETAAKIKEFYKNSGMKRLIFMSDIRINPEEDDVIKDMELQQGWVSIMEPDLSVLKFRLPWNKPTMSYLDGIVFIQQYPPRSSTESRLYILKSQCNSRKEYDCKKYESQFAYHNRASRLQYYTWANKYNTSVISKVSGMDHCYDCSACLRILEEYNDAFPEVYKGNILVFMQELLKYSLSEHHNMNTWYAHKYIESIGRGIMKPLNIYEKLLNDKNNSEDDKKMIIQDLDKPMYLIKKMFDKFIQYKNNSVKSYGKWKK